MAITGVLVSANAVFGNGTCTLQYGVDMVDDQLGNLGNRGYTVVDPAINAQVYAYVEQMLPTIAAQVGVPVILPPAPPAPVED
jgi:hypothetical protein